MKRLVLACLLLGLCAATCAREDGQPDPPQQVLVPCDACLPDAGIDALDAGPDA